jgi:hypothetical protein
MWQLGLKSRLFGKVDQVPNICYVATEFFHIGYIPLVPLQTWLIIVGSETDVLIYESWKGVQIPRFWKSVVYAWVRAPLLILGFGGPLVAWLRFNDRPRGDEVPFTGLDLLCWIGVSALLFGAFLVTYWLSRANECRAIELKALLATANVDRISQISG